MSTTAPFQSLTREQFTPGDDASAELSLKLAVVIPCYRVGRHLTGVVGRIGPEVSQIFCVIDGCPEDSEEIANQLAQTDSRIRVISQATNSGVGAAVLVGYRAAIFEQADVIIKLDGDGQMAPEDIPCLVRPLVRGEADYVKGNRFFNLEDVQAMPPLRLVGNAGLSFLSKLSSGYWNLFDPTNGFTAIHAKVAAALPSKKISRRFFFESDILFRLNTLRAVVADVPLPARYGDEQSNLKIVRTLYQFPLLHLRNFAKRIFYSYFLRDFNVASINLVLGLALCLFGLGFGLWKWNSGGGVAVPSATVMLAALPMILGWQALLAFIGFDVSNVPKNPIHPMLGESRPKRDESSLAELQPRVVARPHNP
jgi:glycosyltransferase involved in cell wall biosynthesis